MIYVGAKLTTALLDFLTHHFKPTDNWTGCPLEPACQGVAAENFE